SMGVGMGVAIMMQNAGAFVGAPAPATDISSIHAQIRKAKSFAKITSQRTKKILVVENEFREIDKQSNLWILLEMLRDDVVVGG
ncbi:hypothetical protein ANCCEY_05285, partial [Ancylostoma ceylanicum]